ncbi:MAG: NEW3 domain-containing protein [Chloroflexota bacterium]
MRRYLALMGATVALLLGLALPAKALAQQAPSPSDESGLLLFTDFPSRVIGVGETITMNLKLRGNGSPQIVDLATQGVPEDWSVTFRGDGRIVHSVFVMPGTDATVSLRVEPPANVPSGDYRFTVLARAGSVQAQLPISLTVQDRVPPRLTLTSELPTLRGQPGTTFRFNVTLKNEGDDDTDVQLAATPPNGFFVTFRLSGQEVTSVPLPAGESKTVSVEAQASDEVQAGTYPFSVQANSETSNAEIRLAAEVVGRPDLALAAPDGRLSGEATIGSETPIKLQLRNNGTAPVRGIELTSSAPTGWSVEFSPSSVEELAPGQQIDVTANLRPAERAVAGDYVVTFTARPAEGASKSVEFRVTAVTSTLWGVVGIGLIAAAVVVVALAVARFGRR